MCTKPYRPLKDDPPKTAEELLKLAEKRKKQNITSDGSLLGDYVR